MRPAFQRSEARAVLLLERFRGGFAFSAGPGPDLSRESQASRRQRKPRVKRIDPGFLVFVAIANERGARRPRTRREARGYLATLSRKTIVLLYFWPGSRRTGANCGLFGASGKCCGSSAMPSPWR